MAKERIKKIVFYSSIIFFGLALTIVFYLILKNQTGAEPVTKKIFLVLRPFVIGAVIAYIMKGTCNFFERLYKKLLLKSGKRTEKKANRIAAILSIVTTYVIWITAITLLISLMVQPLIESISNLFDMLIVNVPLYANKLTTFIETKALDGGDTAMVWGFLQKAIENITSQFTEWSTSSSAMVQQIGTQLLQSVLDIIVLIKDVLIGFVVSVLFLAGRKTLAKRSVTLVRGLFKENTATAIIDEFKFADRMFSGFLEGKVIDSTIIGVIYYIAMLIMGIPYAPLIAVVCGVTNIIPIFGPFLGAIPSGIIILSAGQPIKVLWFVIFVCVMQFIDGYIIDPHIVGGNIKISSFSVIFSVIFFGGLWGFSGLLVGVPVFAVIYDIAKKLVVHIFKKKGKADLLIKHNVDIGIDKTDNGGDNTKSGGNEAEKA